LPFLATSIKLVIHFFRILATYLCKKFITIRVRATTHFLNQYGKWEDFDDILLITMVAVNITQNLR